ETFVMSRKKKIILYVSWSEGKVPQGAAAKAVEYYANIKLRVDRLIVFPKSRYGGNMPFVIWEQGAKAKWGKEYGKIIKAPPKPRAAPSAPASEPETISQSQTIADEQLSNSN